MSRAVRNKPKKIAKSARYGSVPQVSEGWVILDNCKLSHVTAIPENLSHRLTITC